MASLSRGGGDAAATRGSFDPAGHRNRFRDQLLHLLLLIQKERGVRKC